MRKTICLLAVTALFAGTLAGCSSNSKGETTAAQTKTEAASGAEQSEENKEESPAAPSGDLKKIVIGASPAPHAEILRAAGEVWPRRGMSWISRSTWTTSSQIWL